ncbi:MAG: hypothetical protein HQ592_05525 [Planctomycetes bacterium]|nr:hypothetical protein [Planctomycetota bacterium]
MNKWLALIIGMFIVVFGLVVSIQLDDTSASLVVLFAGQMLALAVFIIFLRKHTAVLVAGFIFQVLIILGLIIVALLDRRPADAARGPGGYGGQARTMPVSENGMTMGRTRKALVERSTKQKDIEQCMTS